VVGQEIKNPNWLSGFVDGEGCFFISLIKSKKYKVGSQVQLRFLITQHIRDEELMKSLIKYLGCGKLYNRSNREIVEYVVTKSLDISEILIPYFDQYPLQSSKFKDFNDFKKVVYLIKNEEHLTQDGFAKIKKIKSEMSKRR
jgi:hypothetical protein